MNKLDKKINGGLNDTPEDNRDAQLGAYISLPKLEELPDEFILDPGFVYDQRNGRKDTDFCGAAGGGLISSMQEGEVLLFEWIFAVSKMMTGDPAEWGQNIRAILKAIVKHGAPKRKGNEEYTLERKSGDDLRHIENYPDRFFDEAKEHAKQSFLKVTGPYNDFDNMRASVYKFRKLKRALIFGMKWKWSISTATMPNDLSPGGSGHLVTFLGWKKIDGEYYAVIQNSYGLDAGEKGRHYFPRDLVNKAIREYRGAFMLIDLPAELVKNAGKYFFSRWYLKLRLFLMTL